MFNSRIFHILLEKVFDDLRRIKPIILFVIDDGQRFNELNLAQS
jgi:hypothetical protein